jgi:hypothetical protein
MSVVGDVLGDILNPALGKPDPEAQENATETSTRLAEQAAGMSANYFNATGPMRNSLITRLTDFMKGNLDPTDSAMYAPIKMTAERQYDTAREKTLEDLPRGGALYASLSSLAGQKANTITDMISQIVQDEYNKAYAMGQGSQQVAAAGITSAGDSQSKLLQALGTQQQAGAQQGSNTVGLLKLIADIYAA